MEWQQKWNLFCSTGPWRTSLSIWASARRGKPINCHPPRSFQFQPPLSPHRPCGPPQLLYPSPPETPVKVAWVWGNAGAWQPAPEDCTGTHQVCQSQTASIHHSLRYLLLSKTRLARDVHDCASAVVWNFFQANTYVWYFNVWTTIFEFEEPHLEVSWFLNGLISCLAMFCQALLFVFICLIACYIQFHQAICTVWHTYLWNARAKVLCKINDSSNLANCFCREWYSHCVCCTYQK